MKLCESEGFIDGVVASKTDCEILFKEYISEKMITLKSNKELPLNKMIRINVYGDWYLSDQHGAMPIDGCEVISFEFLDGSTIMDSMSAIAALEHEGWNSFADPIAEWKKIRSAE
jgi:hypothetical protein